MGFYRITLKRSERINSKQQNFFLIGLPGSGKSTLGKSLADFLSLRFVDLDEEIERHTGAPIRKIMEESGEDYFRTTEQHCLSRVLNFQPGFVLACGGGTPCFFDNLPRMQASGLVIFLNPPLELIAQRLMDSGFADRPLLAGADDLSGKISRLYALRSKFYLQADIIYPGFSAEELAIRISVAGTSEGN